MEDLWQKTGIVDDDVKKQMVGKYADQESEGMGCFGDV